MGVGARGARAPVVLVFDERERVEAARLDKGLGVACEAPSVARHVARQLVVLLAVSGGVLLEAIAKRAGLLATRSELVDVHASMAEAPRGRRLADLAVLVHRLERGIRLM